MRPPEEYNDRQGGVNMDERRVYAQEPVDTSELRRLHAMLNDAGIRHQLIEEKCMGGATIKIPGLREWRRDRGISVIQHYSSFGGRSGKLECWCKLPKCMEGEPHGWMSAEEVFERIREALAR